jgi:uncharacterized protein (TIGR02594 family)
MTGIPLTPYHLALKHVGIVKEIPGEKDHPLIRWWLSRCGFGLDVHDEIAWCSAFVNGMCWPFESIPMTHSAAARSWLRVGQSVPVELAAPGFDVCVFKRGPEPQPGPDVIAAPGHVAFFQSFADQLVQVIGGNQCDAVTIARFPLSHLLDVRRLAP